jgi:hypothetical protein
MFLRIEMGVAQNAINPLSGITSSSRIRHIVVHFRAEFAGNSTSARRACQCRTCQLKRSKWMSSLTMFGSLIFLDYVLKVW